MAERCVELVALEEKGQLHRFTGPHELRATPEARALNELLNGCHALERMRSEIHAAEATTANVRSAPAAAPPEAEVPSGEAAPAASGGPTAPSTAGP